MAQSIELLLDAGSEEIVRAQWRTLHKAGLPTEHRGGDRPGNEHHRPHITLFAGPSVPEPEAELAELVDELLGLRVILGSILLFGPRRGAYVIVRQVLPTPGLLAVQQQVAGWCGALLDGQFGRGRWAPHVTLARRARAEDLAAMLTLLPEQSQLVTITGCRRWDGTAKTAWLL